MGEGGNYTHQGIHSEDGGTIHIRVLTIKEAGSYIHLGTHDEGRGELYISGYSRRRRTVHIRVLTMRVS